MLITAHDIFTYMAQQNIYLRILCCPWSWKINVRALALLRKNNSLDMAELNMQLPADDLKYGCGWRFVIRYIVTHSRKSWDPYSFILTIVFYRMIHETYILSFGERFETYQSWRPAMLVNKGWEHAANRPCLSVSRTSTSICSPRILPVLNCGATLQFPAPGSLQSTV